jgi:RNA polymerase sigma factor (TIGR02999 family)
LLKEPTRVYDPWQAVMNMLNSDSDVSGLLQVWRDGDPAAFEALVPLVESELRRISRQQLARMGRDFTLTTTSLVQEAFVKLIGNCQTDWQGRSHFFALCAKIMRDILVDHARARLSAKRGGGGQQVPFNEGLIVSEDRSVELLTIHNALDELTKIDSRKGRVVEMRFFGGMSVEETAEGLGVSAETVTRDWRIARIWLLRYIDGSRAGARRMATS